ncbi:MAG: type II toxin-antitoxin system Phd/YefM family antitoxin [Petrotogales bacterium]
MPKLEKLHFYTIAEAKANLSKVIGIVNSDDHDVIITKNGLPSIALLSYEKYVKIQKFLDSVYELYLMDAGTDAASTDLKDILNSAEEE